ncbi:hypothetical protein ACFE04_031982 [Oxalis oulophora]
MDKSVLNNTHIKLLCSDLNTLTQTRSNVGPTTTFLHHNNLIVSHVEILGVVTFVDHKPDKFIRFSIDDGTDIVLCILWLNQLTSNYYSRRNPSTVRLIAHFANSQFAKGIKIGVMARVRGRVTSFRSAMQITVSDVVFERDPNVEILHWLDCLRLARKCYDVVAVPK